MKKYLLLVLFVFLFFPAIAKAETIEISCDKKEVKRNEEVICQILAKEIDFNTTSVSGKIVLDENLELVSSNYNKNVWKVLDSEFNVSNINLISEEIINEPSYEIAIFKIKAVNDKKNFSKIILSDVLIGDDKYEDHQIVVEDYSIYVENEKIVNPSTNIDYPILYYGVTLGVCACGFYLLKKKKYI